MSHTLHAILDQLRYVLEPLEDVPATTVTKQPTQSDTEE